MVDVEYFYAFLVVQGVWHGPAVDCSFLKVHGTLVVSVVELSESDQRNEPRVINVISDFFFDDSNAIALLFIEKRNSASNRPRLFKSVNDFVIARRIDCCDRAAGGQRSHDGDTGISLMNVELDFLIVLQDWADRNRNACRPESDIGKVDTASLRANRS